MTGISEIGNVGAEGKHAGETWLCPLCDKTVPYGTTCPDGQHGTLNLYGKQSIPTTPDGWYEWWAANGRYGKELWTVDHRDVAEPYHSHMSVIEDPRKLPWWNGLAQEYIQDDFWELNIKISTTEITVKKYIQD